MPRAPFYKWRLGGSKPENEGYVRPGKTDTMTERRAMAAAPRTFPHVLFSTWIFLPREMDVPCQRRKGHFSGRTRALGMASLLPIAPEQGTHRCATPLHAPWPQAGSPSSTASAYGSPLPTSHTGAATFISSTENKSRRTQKHTALEDGQEGWRT